MKDLYGVGVLGDDEGRVWFFCKVGVNGGESGVLGVKGGSGDYDGVGKSRNHLFKT